MDILVLGLNHKTAGLAIREKFSVPPHRTGDLLKDLAARRIFDERLLLSTCNRIEIYGAGRNPAEAVEKAKRYLSEYSRLDLSAFEDKLYVLKQPDSVQHLFSVASGLDSLVIGETEITGQVKDAYLRAHKNRQTGKVLNALFQRSLKVAKNLRTQTQIGQGRVSIASVAVDLAGKIFADLKNVRVMLIGTGEMSTQLLKAMTARGAAAMIVSSRHFERAQEMAGEFGGQAVAYRDYERHVEGVDILITSTLAPRVLIRQAQVKRWMKIRRERPLFLMDIAVPRNIDSEADKLDNVYLYNIDDLKDIADRNLALRESRLEECLGLVKSQTELFMGWLGREFA